MDPPLSVVVMVVDQEVPRRARFGAVSFKDGPGEFKPSHSNRERVWLRFVVGWMSGCGQGAPLTRVEFAAYSLASGGPCVREEPTLLRQGLCS